MIQVPLLPRPKFFPCSSSERGPQEFFAVDEPVYLSRGEDSPPDDLQGLLTLRGLFMEDLEISLGSLAKKEGVEIPLPNRPGRYCLEGLYEKAGEKKRYFWILHRGDLSDYIPFCLKESSLKELVFFEEMKRWEQSRILGKLKAYGKNLYPGERILAHLSLSRRREGVFTNRRLLLGKDEVIFSRVFSHWKEGVDRLTIESLVEPARGILSLVLPTGQRDFLFAFFSRLLKLPPEIRYSPFEGESPYSFPSQREMVERRKALSWYSLLGSILLVVFSSGLLFLFLNRTDLLTNWGKGVFLVLLFLWKPLYSLRKSPFRGEPLAGCSSSLLGEYTPEEIEEIRAEIIKEQTLTFSFPLYVFSSVSPTVLSPSLSLLGRKTGLSISSHLFHSLDRGELKALLSFEMAKVEKRPVPFFEVFHFSFGLFLFVSCLLAPFPLWIFLMLLGFIWGEALFNYGKRKSSYLDELLLLSEIGRTGSALSLINSWIKADARREICARLELLGGKILSSLYPGTDRKLWWSLTERVKKELPQGFIPLSEAMDLLVEKANSMVPGGIHRADLEVYFDSLRINWKDFDNRIEDNRLDERELIPFLEALHKNPLPLFPLLPPRSGEPRVEERILFLALNSHEIEFGTG